MKILGIAVIALGVLIMGIYVPALDPSGRPIPQPFFILGLLLLVVGIGVTALSFYQKRQRKEM
jgi:hypothetical protein